MTSNRDLGLPDPVPYDGERFDVTDYLLNYPEAKTDEEAVEMRGFEAFVRDVRPEDFLDVENATAKLVGTAMLWAQSTWAPYLGERDVELERSAAGIKVGDMVEARVCSEAQNERGYGFFRLDGTPLPFEPYHDYDDLFFGKALASLAAGEKLVCRVRSSTCNGGDGVPKDPDFCWRVYSCKVTVYRVR